MIRQARAALFIISLITALTAMACGGADTPQPEPSPSATRPPAAASLIATRDPTGVPQPTSTTLPSLTIQTPTPTPGPTPAVAPPTPEPTSTPPPTRTNTPIPQPTSAPLRRLDITVDWEDATPELRYMGWKTDFTRSSVPYSDIKRGGPPRDGIPPIDNPVFESVSDASSYLSDNEPVLSVEMGGEARAYPLAILIWHEIVNDEVDDIPIAVTYCPLCNTAIVFDRRVGADKRVLDFGTSGNLRNSDLIMWDRQTESWWQQVTGQAIVGEYTGTTLDFLPATLVSWQDFKNAFPDGEALSRDTGFTRDYSRPPYAGYDSGGGRPFLFSGELDDRLPVMERVVGLNMGDTAVAYPFTLFESFPIVNDSIEDADIAIFYTPGTLSAFRGVMGSENPVVGSTGVYDPNLDGRKLTFRYEDGLIVDDQTGSEWNIFGEATDGPLKGSVLAPVIHANHFWFAWRVFNPDTLIKSPDEFGK